MVSRFALFIGFLTAFCGLLSLYLLQLQLPDGVATLWQNNTSDAPLNFDLLLVQSYTLPRLTMAILAGGILGFASLLLQQIMGNALASDNTLGISSGAQFALFVCAIFMPDYLAQGSSFIALLGAALSLALVLLLAWRKTMSPLLLILAGLVVNLYLGSFSAMMMLFYPEESRGLAQWGAGSLAQESWRDSQLLLLQTLPALALVAALRRPLSILSLNDSNAQSLGVPVNRLRFIGVAISAFLIAAVTSAVGMLGFIGLASATIVRQFGVRSFSGQLLGSFATGALLLLCTDLLLQLVNHFYAFNLPTGAVTALLGTPLLLWLMFRALPASGRLTDSNPPIKVRSISKKFLISCCTLLLLGSLLLALCLGKQNQQWHWLWLTADNMGLLELRAPRILLALCVGVLLALAGLLLQRLTLNPMASPELIGVSSGTSMGILLAIFAFSSTASGLFWAAGIGGALFALAAILFINQRNGMLPEKILLTGLSLSALFDTLQRLVIASGDPRANLLISWTSGSTQQADLAFTLPFLLLTLLLFGASFAFARWLELLALQAPMAQALGLNLTRTRLVLILFCALLTAIATLFIGPLSFIGLLVPHLSRFFGVRQVRSQLGICALLGAIIMVLADWFGRQILSPYEVPAGLVATLIGGTYFLLTMRKV